MKAVIYTRVSTDGQREASHDDQARNCQQIADREGWTVIRRYRDHAISGTRSDRPEYQEMLAAAKAGGFEVLLIDEQSRFSRDTIESERAMRFLEHHNIRIVTLDGYDSKSPARKLHRGMKALMNAEYIEGIRHETHRGLTGKALKGESVGGRAYGYRSEPIIGSDGKVTGASVLIDEDQARWVRQVFNWYADGFSPRRIASELNKRAVPSPGATWKRTTRRRDGKWLSSTIYGDPKRASGMLHNDLYRGVRVWNRSRRVTDPETEKKIFLRRPENEHVTVEVPQLRIIDDALWARVRAREVAIRQRIGARVELGIARGITGKNKLGLFVRRGLRDSRGGYFLSGLVKCSDCNASYVITGPSQIYVCASKTNGGKYACANHLKIKRTVLEARLLSGISEELCRPEWEAQFVAECRSLLAARNAEANADRRRYAKRLAKLSGEKSNLVKAIKAGILTATTKAELEAIEAEEARLTVDPIPAEVVGIFPRAVEHYRALVRDLPATLAKDPRRARNRLREFLGGDIVLRMQGTGMVAEVPLALPAKLLNYKDNISIGSGGRI
jgi:site-specific DNA recombinase